MTDWTIIEGDCVEQMRAMPEASVDAVVCDPPYGLEFMGKAWDAFRLDDPGTARHRGENAGEHGERGGAERWGDGVRTIPSSRTSFGGTQRAKTNRCVECGKRDQFRNPHEPCGAGTWRAELIDPHAAPPTMLAFQEWSRQWALEAKRVLKPGAYLVAAGGSRTYHRLTCAVEDAGFEIRDTIAWMYGSGFPKSLDVSKAIDNAAGATREVVGTSPHSANRAAVSWTAADTAHDRGRMGAVAEGERTITAPATPDAARWQGWGTALKPAHEPIVVARKPLSGTVAANVLAHGTGALNISGCRIEHAGAEDLATSLGKNPGRDDLVSSDVYGNGRPQQSVNTAGRWPANVVLDPDAAAMLDEQTGPLHSQDPRTRQSASKAQGVTLMGTGESVEYGDSGGASRFFYVAKASSAERGAGLDYARDSKICGCPTRKAPAASPPRATSEPTEADAFDSSTAGSGSSTTDRSPMGSRSTISTRTRPTTESGTSSSSPPSTTSESTLRTTGETMPVSGNDDVASAANGSRPTPSTTTSAAKAGPSTDAADRATSRTSSQPSSSAVCADCGGVIEGAWKNTHPLEPTVKPINLMRWLVRLVTPPGGLVLDPFTGSGTTGCAAALEGFRFVGIEREPEYAAIARARIAWWAEHPDGMELVDRLEAEKTRKAVADSGQLDIFGAGA